MDDTFTLYDLKVEVVAGDRPMVCSHKVGDYFLVQGENLVFPKETSFSHVFPERHPAASSGKRTAIGPERLDALRRGDRLPGSELRGEI